MFDIFDRYAEQVSEAGARFGTTAVAYAERVIAHLDAIREAVESEDFSEDRRWIALTVGAGALERADDIPAGAIWEVEAVTADAAGQVTVMVDGQVRWRGTFANPDTKDGTGVLARGAGRLQVTASAPVAVVLQVKIRAVKASRRAMTGDIVREPDRRQENTTGRHTPNTPAVAA